jgi:hypothetical protein
MRALRQHIRSTIAIAWAAPWTLFGLIVGGIMLVCGDGGIQRSGCVIEIHGRGPGWFLKYFPIVAGASAVTFGHVILARSRADLDECRAHELVHVRQYERWGPLFVPAYLLCWLVLALRGRSGYWDNPFEREAYGRTDGR